MYKTEIEASQKTTFEVNGLQIQLALVDITPDVAKDILSRNNNNRTISSHNIKFLTDEILNDNWQFDGQPIRIDYNGNLLDGQHRLKSIIKSGQTMKSLVISGLKPETFKVMDTGKVRNGADILSIERISEPSLTANALQFVNSIKLGKFASDRKKVNSLSNTDLVEYYKTNRDISNSVDYVKEHNKSFKSYLNNTYLTTFHYLFSEVSKTDANEFVSKLCSGIGLEEGSPILALRNKLIKAKANDRYKLTKKDIVQYIILSWNKYRDGEYVKVLATKKDYTYTI